MEKHVKKSAVAKLFGSLFVLLVLSFVQFSCSSTKPMTKKIDRYASQVGEIKNFQYYVSTNIVLSRTEDPDIIGKVSEKGSIKITENKDIIQITTSTMGALLKTEEKDGYKIYHIAFEVDNDNCLRFKQMKPGDEQRIYIMYDDPEQHAVVYGNSVYIVEWKGVESLKGSKFKAKKDNMLGKMKGFFKGVKEDKEDDPYLLVKMKTKIKEKENYRKASGRKVEVK